ncbi:MAG: ice-binding family protein [Acidimicrobiia bacterium]
MTIRGRTATTQTSTHRRFAAATAFALMASSLLMITSVASAVIVPTVNLGTADDFSVLGGSAVTNTGSSTLEGAVGVSPGTSITGFPPGVAGSTATATVAAQGQTDSTAAYLDAKNRTGAVVTAADLGGVTLIGGVYSASAKGPLSLTGTLTLDGEGNPNSVWIFQTDSTLTTASGSIVSLINGAQPCNVFWQVGSSATIGTSTDFVGNILALAAITVTTGADVQGRALAQNEAVTLDTNDFTQPLCDLSVATTTTTTTTTIASTTTTAAVGGTTTTTVGDGTTPTQLPFTGASTNALVVLAVAAMTVGTTIVWVDRRQRP